jgi:cytochrome c5
MRSDSDIVRLWGVLMAALVLSLVAGIAGSPRLAVALVFGVAVVKAGLVLAVYMHLGLAPAWIRRVALSAALVVAAFTAGVWPDVVGVFGRFTAGGALASVQSEPPARSGTEVFASYCQVCHQGDCRGGGGRTAPDVVADPPRMRKTDEELLARVNHKKSGLALDVTRGTLLERFGVEVSPIR